MDFRQSAARIGNFLMQRNIRTIVAILVLAVGVPLLYFSAIQIRNDSSNFKLAENENSEIPKSWQDAYFGAVDCAKIDCGLDSDPDQDQLTTKQEYYLNSDPLKKNDLDEILAGLNLNMPGFARSEDRLSSEQINAINAAIDAFDPNLIPKVSESELRVSASSSREQFLKYMADLDALARNNANFRVLGDIASGISQNNPIDADKFNALVKAYISGLKQIEVPKDAIELHKYQIATWLAIPEVKIASSPEEMAARSSAAKQDLVAQAVYLVINQKIADETRKLLDKYQDS